MEKITATSMTQLIEQLNNHFSILYSSPLFKGLPGTLGNTGGPGSVGIRGSMFTYLDLASLNITFGSTYTADNFNETVMHSLIASDLSGFLASTTLTSIVNGDILILPNGQLFSWLDTDFVYTGIDLVVPSEAISMADALLILQQTTVNAASTIASFQLKYKKYKDSDTVNNVLNDQAVYSDSILDPATSTSGIGYVFDDAVAFGVADGLAMFSSSPQQIMAVSGHLSELHDMIQNVLVTSTIDTVVHAKQIKNGQIPAHVILQNDRKTGLALGLRTDTNVDKMGSIYMIAENVLAISNMFGTNSSEHRLLIGEDLSGAKYSSVYGRNILLSAIEKIKITANNVGVNKLLMTDANGFITGTIDYSASVYTSGNMVGFAGNNTFATTTHIQNYISTVIANHTHNKLVRIATTVIDVSLSGEIRMLDKTIIGSTTLAAKNKLDVRGEISSFEFRQNLYKSGATWKYVVNGAGSVDVVENGLGGNYNRVTYVANSGTGDATATLRKAYSIDLPTGGLQMMKQSVPTNLGGNSVNMSLSASSLYMDLSGGACGTTLVKNPAVNYDRRIIINNGSVPTNVDLNYHEAAIWYDATRVKVHQILMNAWHAFSFEVPAGCTWEVQWQRASGTGSITFMSAYEIKYGLS